MSSRLAELPLQLDQAGASMELPLSITAEAYDRITGQQDALDDDQEDIQLALHPQGQTRPEDPAGFAHRWPRLWTRFGSRHPGRTTPPRSNTMATTASPSPRPAG